MIKYVLIATALATAAAGYYRHESNVNKHKFEVERGAKFILARRLATSQAETVAALASRQTVADWDLHEATTTADQCQKAIRAAVAGVRVKPVTVNPILKDPPNATNACPTYTCPPMYRLRDVQTATRNGGTNQDDLPRVRNSTN